MEDRKAERRLITALFVDLVGSTELQMKVGPERLKRALDQAFAEIRDLIVGQGGTVEKYIGDAVFAIFGAPTSHADDPARALRAAAACVEWAEGAKDRPIPLGVRLGAETGEALVDIRGAAVERQQMAVGACVNVAARLQQLAEPGTVLVGPVLRDAAAEVASFEDLGPSDLKGLGTVVVARLTRVSASSARAELPFVGRDAELDLLALAWRRARSGRSVLALVAGPPGQGKTRLVQESVRRMGGDVRALVARCRPGGENGALNPLRQLIVADAGEASLERVAERSRELFDDPAEAARVADALAHSAGLGTSAALAALGLEERQDEITSAWRRYFGALARRGPIAVWIEDVHWAEPELVRLVDRLTVSGDGPLLVIATARPEFAEAAGVRPGGDRFFVELDALEEDAAAELARTAGARDDATARRGGGNPLFIIELARSRTADDALPVTLHGAIGARLDDLSGEDRELLQRSAVAGETFSATDAALLCERDAADVARALERLADRLYLHPARGAYRFHHALVRDVAYQRLPIAERMRLHARYARNAVHAEDVEALAHHWWEAMRPPDAEWVWEGEPDLATDRREAFRANLAAGRRHAERFAHASAVGLLERAAVLAQGPLERALAERALGDTYRLNIESDAAWEHYLKARDAYREAGDAPADLYPRVVEVPIRWPGGFREQPDDAIVHALLDEGEEAARRSGEDLPLVEILLARARLRRRDQGKFGDGAEIDEALRILDRRGDLAGIVDTLEEIGSLLLYGREDVDSARPIFERVDRLIARGGRIADEDSYFGHREALALALGDLASAWAVARRELEVDERRGPHLLSHALARYGSVALQAGEHGVVLDMAARARALVGAHPNTQFCPYGAGLPLASAALVHALEGRREQAEELIRDALRSELRPRGPRDELLVVLVYAVLGRVGDVERVLRTGQAFAFSPGRSAAAALLTGRSSDVERGLARLDAMASRGDLFCAALAEAIREEVAAAEGGPRPRHEALRRMGSNGWSEILSFRPTLA